VNDDRRRLDDIVAATGDAALIVQRGRAAFDADPLVVRAAKNIVTEIGEATKALSSDTTDAIADVPWRDPRDNPGPKRSGPRHRSGELCGLEARSGHRIMPRRTPT